MEENKSCGVLKNSSLAASECVRLGNKLTRGLSLPIPTYNNAREITTAHLVEMHCRLMGLSFAEYTPQPQSWKAIDDILLSLRQKFGLHSFAHLDSLLVATGEPTNLLCLLEIFDTMYEHYRRRGHSFSQPVVRDETLLTSSDGPDGLSHARSSDTSGNDLNIRILIDMENDEIKGIGLENQKHPIDKVNIWKRSNEKSEDKLGSMKHIDVDAHFPSHSLKLDKKTKDSSSKPIKVTKSKLFEAPKSRHQKPTKENINRNDRGLNKTAKSHNTTEHPSAVLRSSSTQPSLPSSTPNDFLYSKIKSKQAAISPTDSSVAKSELFDQDISSSPPENLQYVLDKFYPESKTRVPPNKEFRDRNVQMTQPKNTREEPDIRINIEIEDSQYRGSDADAADEPDALIQLNSMHAEIQKYIRRQLSKMEEQINSMNDECCELSGSNQHRRNRTRSKSKPYPPCKPGTKLDYFGNPVYERFPYYPRGIIVPRCHSPPLKCRPKDSSESLYNLISKLCDGKLLSDSNQEIFGSKRSQTNRPSTLCAKILTNVLIEFPNVQLENKLFGRLSRKCEEYIKVLDTHDLNEREIRKKAEIKMRELVRSNYTATKLEKKLDDAAHRRKSLAKSKSLSRAVAAAERGTQRQQSAIAKIKDADIKSRVLKTIASNMVESQNVTALPDEALRVQQKGVLTLRADKKARADKVYLDADKELINLQQFYTNQLAVFRKDAQMLKQSGPNAEKELQKLWHSCRLTIQNEIDNCVDKIIESIATIYSMP